MKGQRKTRILAIFVCMALFVSAMGLTAGAAGKTTKQKAVFSYKTYQDTYKNNAANVTAVYKFVLPQLKGSSAAVKKINKSLNKVYKDSLQQKTLLMDYAKNRTAYTQYQDKYFFKTTCKATYNKKGYVSFRFKADWYAGGVHNMYHYGANYSLKTGKKLALTDVVSGGRSQIKKAIADKYYNKLGSRYASRSQMRSAINKRKWSELYFYLKNGKVYVSCGAYAPLGGNGEVTVALKGKY